MQQFIEWQNVIFQNPAFFGIFMVTIWILALLTISRLSGWARLAERYSTAAEPETGVMRMVRAQWGTIMITGNIYTIACNKGGLYLAVLFPFRLGHPPLLIPWHDIKAKKISSFLAPRIQLEFGGGVSRPFEIHESTAERIKACSNGKFSY